MDENENPIANAKVTVIVENMTKELESDINGKIIVPLNNLTAGNHTITINFNGNEFYNPANTTKIITVNRLGVKLETNNLTMKYGDGSKFKVRLVDLENNPIKREIITILLNNILYTEVTNDEGYVEILVKDKAGIYAAVTSYEGSAKYENISDINNKVDIKVPIKLTGNKDFYVL